MRRARCYNCGEPVEQTGKCGVCAWKDEDGQHHYYEGGWPNENITQVHDRLSRWLDEHYYPGAHDDLRQLYERGYNHQIATEKRS